MRALARSARESTAVLACRPMFATLSYAKQITLTLNSHMLRHGCPGHLHRRPPCGRPGLVQSRRSGRVWHRPEYPVTGTDACRRQGQAGQSKARLLPHREARTQGGRCRRPGRVDRPTDEASGPGLSGVAAACGGPPRLVAPGGHDLPGGGAPPAARSDAGRASPAVHLPRARRPLPRATKPRSSGPSRRQPASPSWQASS